VNIQVQDGDPEGYRYALRKKLSKNELIEVLKEKLGKDGDRKI